MTELTIEKVHKALKTVRDKLADGTIPAKHFNMGYVLEVIGDDDNYEPDPSEGFDELFACGTIGCIAGWIAVELKTSYNEEVISFSGDYVELNRLFYPGNHFPYAWGSITPEEAVKIIDIYLESGYARWDYIVADRRK